MWCRHQSRSGDDMAGHFSTSAENRKTLRHQDSSAPEENWFDSLLLRPGRGVEYCDKPVVCLYVREHISGTAGPIFPKFGVQIPCHCGCGTVLLWQHCAMLCTYGFMGDVTFSRNGPYDAVLKLRMPRRVDIRTHVSLLQRACTTNFHLLLRFVSCEASLA